MAEYIPHAVDGIPLVMAAWLNARNTGAAACDAGQVLAASEALKSVEAQLFAQPEPPLKSAQIIPRKFDAGAWATSTSFFTVEGQAQMLPVADMGNDRPEASFGLNEDSSPVREFGNAYGYGRKELIYAAKLGVPLDAIKARLCMRAYELLVDQLAATGDSPLKLKGLLNNTLIPRESSAVGIDSGSSNTDILRLLNEIAGRVPDRTDEVGMPDMLVLPLLQRDYIANTPFNSSSNGDSILQVFLKNNEYIKQVVSWKRLKAAGRTPKGGAANHVIYCGSFDEMVLRQQIPEPLNTMGPQMQGSRTITNCYASIGSVEVIRPKELQLYEIPNNDAA